MYPLRALRQAVVIFLTLTFGAAFLSGSEAQEAEVDPWTAQHFRLASEAHRRNDLDVAAREYELILSKMPQFAEAYQNLGIVYHQQRRFLKAVETLEKGVSINPNLLGGQLVLGISKYKVQDFKGALGPLQKALDLKPTDREAGLYLALTYRALGRPEEAATQLRKTAKHFPDDLEIAFQLGEAYMEGVRQGSVLLSQDDVPSALSHWARAISHEHKGDTVGAILEYLRALGADPNIVELYWRLAQLLQKAGVPALSAAALERYMLLNPTRDPADLRTGPPAAQISSGEPSVLEHEKSFQRLWDSLAPADPARAFPGVADEFVNRALQERLASPEGAGLKQALQLYAKGDYRTAARQIKERVRRADGDWASAYVLSRAYFLASDNEAAEEVLENQLSAYFHLPSVALLRVEVGSRLALGYFSLVAAKEPESYRTKLLEAKLHVAAGRDQEAITNYQEALSLAPDQSGIHLAIGQLYQQKLNWPAAIEEFEAELALAPDNALALALLGHAYTEARDLDLAIQTLSKLLESHPDDGQAYADLGKAWALKGDMQNAIEAYERALLCNPTLNSLHYRLVQLYTKTGQTARAQSHLAALRSGDADKRKKHERSLAGLKDQSD